MKIKILGISGSPRNGNTLMMVKKALEAASKIKGVECSICDLKGKIQPCTNCDKCPVNPPTKHCVFNDKISEIYPKLIEADGIIIGTPVYANNVNAQVKALMDRCVTLVREGMLLRYKVGGAIAVGGGRHAGQEKAISTIIDFFLIHGMYPVSLPVTLQVGASGLAWRPNTVDKDTWLWQYQDAQISALYEAEQLGNAVAVTCKIIKEGLKKVNPKNFIKVFEMNETMRGVMEKGPSM